MIKIILSIIALLSIANLISTCLILLLYFFYKNFLHNENNDSYQFIAANYTHKLYLLLIIIEVIVCITTLLLAKWSFSLLSIPYTNLYIIIIFLLIFFPFLYKYKILCDIFNKNLLNESVSDHAIYKK